MRIVDESFKEVGFPMAGVDMSNAFARQLAVPMPSGEYGRTTRYCKNVRGYEPGTGRRRGGQRSGLDKFLDSAVVADWIVQDLNVVVHVGGSPVQQSQSGRVVTLVAVSQGEIYSAQAGATSWTQASNLTGQAHAVSYSGIVLSTSINQRLYYVDGVNYTYFDPAANAAYRWVPSAGVMPTDSNGAAARLICTWRGRTVLSGIIGDPQNWFMSAVGDPSDFDYFPAEISPAQAIAGNNSPLGLIGDVVTCMIPYTDDVLIMGGDHTIYMFRGDPMAGGQIDLVSHAIGMAWGAPWAMDPYGTIYFMSNRTGIYKLIPGQKPERISQQIEQLLKAYNTGQMTIRFMWNDQEQGLHVFATYTGGPATTTHLFWDMRSGGWFPDQFANENHNPLCCCVFDGNLPGDRAALIGSWDGYVRTLSGSGTTDDGTPIRSSVLIGPINTKNMDDLLFKNLQATMAEDSGDVDYAVYVGASAEIAMSNRVVASGKWEAGRNLSNLVRRSGHALYVKLSASSPWAMETIRASIAGKGKVRMRGI